MQKSKDGKIEYFHKSSQIQLIAETQIVMLLNGLVALEIYLLTECKNHPKQIGKFTALIGIGLVVVFFFHYCYQFSDQKLLDILIPY